MLHSRLARAIGLSEAMKESTERFKISASRSLTRLGSGSENTVCSAMLPANRKVVKEYMMGSTAKEVRLKLLRTLRDEEKKGTAAILTLYQGDPHLVIGPNLPH